MVRKFTHEVENCDVFVISLNFSFTSLFFSSQYPTFCLVVVDSQHL